MGKSFNALGIVNSEWSIMNGELLKIFLTDIHGFTQMLIDDKPLPSERKISATNFTN